MYVAVFSDFSVGRIITLRLYIINKAVYGQLVLSTRDRHSISLPTEHNGIYNF